MKALDNGTFTLDDLTIWVDPGSSVHLKIVSQHGSAIELSGDQARDLADLLVRLAAEADE